MKYLYLWAFSFIVFSVVCSTSGASIDITTIIPLEDEEDSTELITLDYNNDSVSLEEEGGKSDHGYLIGLAISEDAKLTLSEFKSNGHTLTS